MNHHLFFNSNWKLLPGHGLGSTERKLKYFNIFTHIKSKKKRRSQHAEDQEDSELKVSQDTINSSEDRTEVLQEEEATSTQPVPEGTGIPLRTINSTQHNQDTPNHIH